MAEWIGEIKFGPEVTDKIRAKHGLTPTQVRSAVAFGNHDSHRWDEDRRYGRRLIIEGSDEQGALRAYLRPIDKQDGVWECLTAWRV